MTDEQKRKRSYWPALVVMLPLFYVLSVGPAVKLIVALDLAGYDSEWLNEPLTMFYWPLAWGYDNNEMAEAFFDWYLELWVEF